MHRIQVIDSHTGGEPTRVVISGGPDLGGGSVAEQLKVFRDQHDRFRSAIVNEPRGSDVLVGALLCPPADKSCVNGVIFFNNVGMLAMCGHGTIGLIVTLAHLGRIGPGEHRIETCVGVVTATLHPDGSVSVANLPSYRKVKAATVEVPNTDGALGTARPTAKINGDVAWGGNWFFLVENHGLSLDLKNVEQLTDVSWRIRQAVNAQGCPEVDHVELFGPPQSGGHSRNFVLCPGKAYDRSPCGTGTSAKLACLAADGKLAEDAVWIQESILGTKFTGRFHWLDRAKGEIAPVITGTASVNAEATLLLDDKDQFCWGIGAQESILREAPKADESPNPTPVGHRRSSATLPSIPAKRQQVRALVAEKRRHHSPPPPTPEQKAGFSGWRSRGYLPHFDRAGLYQFLTFRLADAMPVARRREWAPLLTIEDELDRLTKIEAYLDKGHGACHLGNPQAAKLVEIALLNFDGERYRLLAWAVMPNHVHVLMEVTTVPMAEILHSWKAFTALEINRLLNRRGPLWQREYFDRYIRDADHFRRALRYIENNPVKAGLVKAPTEWGFSSARRAGPQADRSAGVQPATRLAQIYAGNTATPTPKPKPSN
ncbi:MAG: proline racemase [Limisphaerales bacterium]|nr:MAG: proline racemase [Limisphaerales bacterium]KAG0510593.1 MAG: proline racemase [Limisphaerales bacterium]TXT52865.1 MAG: proline racemase [Limisphaerales bacterium]